MDFETWWKIERQGCRDCGDDGRAFSLRAWDAACKACAAMAEETAAGRDAEAIAEAIIGMCSNVKLTSRPTDEPKT